jgi:cephalosporin hydroxylase
MADISKLQTEQQIIVDEFHKLYYPFFHETKWLGVTALKCPFDLLVYQEIICELRPDLIIECGTAEGGSAVFLASICELIDHGEVVTIDITDKQNVTARPAHPRVTYWKADTLAADTIARLDELSAGKNCVLVILDDDHSAEHVFRELKIYSRFVTPGSYLIVEDTNVNGHPVYTEFGPGPMEAVEQFMRQRNDFEIDRSREKFFVSFNPKGFLRKIGDLSGVRPKGSNGVPATLLSQRHLEDLHRLENRIRLLEDEKKRMANTLDAIYNSRGWGLLERLRRIKRFLLPASDETSP